MRSMPSRTRCPLIRMMRVPISKWRSSATLPDSIPAIRTKGLHRGARGRTEVIGISWIRLNFCRRR